MREGHFVFGISSSNTTPRRIVFVARIEKRMSFKDAFDCFPDLRGPEGPIHVRPIHGTGPFPESEYEHIPESIHASCWEADLRTRELDAFFVCAQREGWIGRWLGPLGPKIDDDILDFLTTRCSVHGKAGRLSAQNADGTPEKPIAYGRLYTGLHLETDQAERLLELCDAYMNSNRNSCDLESVCTPEPGESTGGDCRGSCNGYRPRGE
jgi:hypothetical protein